MSLWLIPGCTGTGRIELAALNYRDIDPPAARFSVLNAQRCYWWTDDDGQVWVSLERDQPVPFRPEHFVFQLSLVFERLPAGRARNYVVGPRELRGVARLGPAHTRYVSIAGIAALYRAPGDRLRGSVRLDVNRRSQALLGGWSRAARYLMLGNFEAVHDSQRGRRIAEQTEAEGWERPASRPADEAALTTQPAR